MCWMQRHQRHQRRIDAKRTMCVYPAVALSLFARIVNSCKRPHDRKRRVLKMTGFLPLLSSLLKQLTLRADLERVNLAFWRWHSKKVFWLNLLFKLQSNVMNSMKCCPNRNNAPVIFHQAEFVFRIYAVNNATSFIRMMHTLWYLPRKNYIVHHCMLDMLWAWDVICESCTHITVIHLTEDLILVLAML